MQAIRCYNMPKLAKHFNFEERRHYERASDNTNFSYRLRSSDFYSWNYLRHVSRYAQRHQSNSARQTSRRITLDIRDWITISVCCIPTVFYNCTVGLARNTDSQIVKSLCLPIHRLL